MFKLFKDLTRPPEPLESRPERPESAGSSQSLGVRTTPARVRSPSGSMPGTSGISVATGVSASTPEPQVPPPVEELGEDAKKVTELVKVLHEEGEVMNYVEALSQLPSIHPSTQVMKVFRLHRGFAALIKVLEHGLSWKAGVEDEERLVLDVQRMEGVRLAFEVLGWALSDRENAKAFENAGGYLALLPALRALSAPPSPSLPSTPTSSHFPGHSTERADPVSLAHLLAHILGDNYTVLSTVSACKSGTPAPTEEELKEKLGDVSLKRPAALPLLWRYIWGLASNTPSEISADGRRKGKEREQSTLLEERQLYSGILEECCDLDLLKLSLRILLITSTCSIANLFAIRQHLSTLPDFLITRLFDYAPSRKYATTFEPREGWCDDLPDEDDEDIASTPWQAPDAGLRPIYTSLLRRVLEGGMDQVSVWRLFALAKNPSPSAKKDGKGVDDKKGFETPDETPTSTRPSSPDSLDSPLAVRPKGKGKQKPNLLISTTQPAADLETLNWEVMDLIRHSMKAKWPYVFIFRGGSGETEGGLELADMARPWPGGQKGINFSCWINITKLNSDITLLNVSQASQKHPLLRIRLLENSQIALTTTVYKPKAPPTEEGETAEEEAPIELVCAAPDALVPHREWVHFAVGLRQLKSGESGEVRIFVNGVRVGAMRMAYPVPAPSPPQPHAPQARSLPAVDPIRLSVGRDWPKQDKDAKEETKHAGKQEDNEWMLGRALLLEEAVPEDIVLLMHHLGPRYTGNFQEALGKFLTYAGATSINLYLSSLAHNAQDKRLFTSPARSLLVRAIRQGPTFAEENILLSLNAHDVIKSEAGVLEKCINGAVSHPVKAQQVRNGTARIVGCVASHAMASLDESVSTVGGGTVILKMIDLSTTSEGLATTLGLLRDMIKDSWSASEEMERIRGFELLAAILRPKVATLLDITCAKIILSMLGINMDKPENATVHNSAAYRALGLEFELWSYAPVNVVTLYLQHFEHLLVGSKHARHNVLRTFQKSAMVRKLLYALRSGLFDLEVVPVIVETLKLALLARWSSEDAIKPVFSYLISALCQSSNSFYVVPTAELPASQAPAAQILAMVAGLASQPPRLVKLAKSLALHRLLIIFISSNSAPYVLVPCLTILQKCLSTPGLESFQRSFEAEGGFALLAGNLGPVWNEGIQDTVFDMMLGPEPEKAKDKDNLKCQQLVSTLLAALDYLLSVPGEEEGQRPTVGRSRSGTITPMWSAMTPVKNGNGDAERVPESTSAEQKTRLESLLKRLTATYQSSHAFRRCITGRKVEQMLPGLAEFAAVSSSFSRPDVARSQRKAAAEWLQILVDKAKISSSLLNQMKLIIEQLYSPMTAPSRTGSVSIPASPRPNVSSSLSLSSYSSRFGSTPPASPSLALGTSFGAPTPRRRPSMEAAGMRPRMADRAMPALKRVLTGESILEGGKDKNAAWKMIIISTDSQSHQKMTLERKDHWQRLSEVDWPRLAGLLRAENGLWPDEPGEVTWRLDGSEGPLRMRMRLERVSANTDLGPLRSRGKLRDAIPSVDELQSAVSRINVAPWEDPFSLALGDAAPIEEEESPLAGPKPPTQPGQSGTSTPQEDDDESYVEVEDDKDDKTRRIARTLQAGDVVEEAHNIVRIVGVDACPGLLILGRKNLYLVDGLVQTATGEVIDAKDAPRDCLSVPGTLADLSSDEQESHRWSYNEIVETNKRAFLFRDVALELYFQDKLNFLLVFGDKRERQNVVNSLARKSDSTGSISRSIVGNLVWEQVSRAIDRSEQQLEAMTRKWQNREISNFAYLQLLNQHANRTPNDVTQYPVFPWVLADYTSEALDLSKFATFRDLSLPMGALTPARKEAAVERYSATEGVGETPFHYGTHYSSSMIVCGFMIRLSPFTEIFLALQGGHFDLADRLFSSVPRAWDSACADNRGDVRELIPEFYYLPAFLLNVNHHDFGRKQVTGDSVDDVALPPWALGDPLLFIHRHREALESDIVSRALSNWIDLTFGYKQREPAAYNCFHPLSYRGAVDLESMTDEGEKAASTAIIHNFGQTPFQLFRYPHPHRITTGKSTLPIYQRFGVAEQWQLLLRSILPITESVSPIFDIANPITPEGKPATQIRHRIVIPGTVLTIQYGFADNSLRVYAQELPISPQRLVLLVEGMSVVHAILAAPRVVVTVSVQGVLAVWRLGIKSTGGRRGDVSFTREATLRGHDTPVTTLTASSAWSIAVSGTEDGRAIVWDMNRMRYIRTLETPHGEPLIFSAVHESDGHIALASRRHVYMYSLNGLAIASSTPEGDLFADFAFGLPETPPESDTNLLDFGVNATPQEYTGGISFLKRDFLKFGPLFVIGINNEVALYRCVPGEKKSEDEVVQPWRLVEQGRLSGSDDHLGGDCCMVKFIGETLYAAFEPEEDGGKYAMYQWSLPESEMRHVPESIHSCMAPACARSFGLLDPKRHCGGCGGVFCGSHAVHVEGFNSRYCDVCRTQLADANKAGILKNRQDSASSSSRRASTAPISASLPGSRRPSVSNGNSSRGSGASSSTASRSTSRARSRRPSFSNSPLGPRSRSGTPVRRSREGTPFKRRGDGTPMLYRETRSRSTTPVHRVLDES